MTPNEPTNNPEDLYPPDPERPEPVEDVPFDPDEDVEEAQETVTITAAELAELGNFLESMRQIVLGHERRIANIEEFLTPIAEAVANEVDADEDEGTDPSSTDGATVTPIDSRRGDAPDTGGTDVPGENA